MTADLHIHSTASDGLFTPARLFELGREAGLQYMALTDHDTLDGLAAWPCEKGGPQLIPGVEISCHLDQDIHLLAYGVREEMTGLTDFLARMRKDRIARFGAMVEKLQALGLSIALDRFDLSCCASIGRAHLARALFESGQVKSVQEAFNRYLSHGCPAYVPRPRLSPRDAILMIRGEGAVPVLAHPGLYSFGQNHFFSLLSEWKEAGLMGLEVYHSANRPPQPYEQMARSLDLMITGGSDFHGLYDGHSPLGSQCAQWHTVDQDMERLLQSLTF